MRLVLTGGHVTPAYSFVEVAAARKDIVLLIGSAGENSIEAREFSDLGCDYRTIMAVKFDRYHKFRSVLTLPLMVVPVIQALYYLYRFKPDGVVSFGSFNALPVCLAAVVVGIPFVLHEQTRTAGLSNRILGRFAKRCVVSYSESVRYFPTKKTVVLGNLLRSAIWNPVPHSPFTLSENKPVLYITGGNQGSRTVNSVVSSLLPNLAAHYQVVWQYGKDRPFPDNSAPPDVIAKPWFSLAEVSWLLHHAHIIVSRGGANTTSEIMVGGTPSIIIPLPHTAANEQTENALKISSTGAGLIIDQIELTGASLQLALNQIESNYQSFKQNAVGLKQSQNPCAAEELYKEVLVVVGQR